MTKTITERQLVLPALYLINESDGIDTTRLISRLEEIMRPEGHDMEILANRGDTHFSQKVRNLKSHDTLQKKGYATYDNGIYNITDAGREYVLENLEMIQYLLGNDFGCDDILDAFDDVVTRQSSGHKVVPIVETIQEGAAHYVVRKERERSSQLRRIAIEHFTHNGHIVCDCCGFDFATGYGAQYACHAIEIHHITPIYMYEGDDIQKTIEKALNNLLPVCPNCHRVIHRKNIGRADLPVFKSAIQKIRSSAMI